MKTKMTPLLTVREAADYLGLAEKTLRNWLYLAEHPGPRVTRLKRSSTSKRGAVRYHRADLDAWLDAQRIAS